MKQRALSQLSWVGFVPCQAGYIGYTAVTHSPKMSKAWNNWGQLHAQGPCGDTGTLLLRDSVWLSLITLTTVSYHTGGKSPPEGLTLAVKHVTQKWHTMLLTAHWLELFTWPTYTHLGAKSFSPTSGSGGRNSISPFHLHPLTIVYSFFSKNSFFPEVHWHVFVPEPQNNP